MTVVLINSKNSERIKMQKWEQLPLGWYSFQWVMNGRVVVVIFTSVEGQKRRRKETEKAISSRYTALWSAAAATGKWAFYGQSSKCTSSSSSSSSPLSLILTSCHQLNRPLCVCMSCHYISPSTSSSSSSSKRWLKKEKTIITALCSMTVHSSSSSLLAEVNLCSGSSSSSKVSVKCQCHLFLSSFEQQ